MSSLDKYVSNKVPVEEEIKPTKHDGKMTKQVKGEKFFETTGKPPQISVNILNHKILKTLNEEGVTSLRVLSQRFVRTEWTILVELRYLESLGLVREVR